MKVLSTQGFSVYIYDKEHLPPHCHVIFSNKEEIVMELPFLDELYGRAVDVKVRDFLLDNLDLLVTIWDQKHPRKF